MSSLIKSKPVQAQPPKAPETPKTPETPQDIKQNTPWMNIAIKENGISEVAGSGDNPRILEYHKQTSLKATDDEVAWCASFVSWVFVMAKLKSKKSARAKDWLEWGKPLDKPHYGCVVVFTRDGGGHVAFFVKEDEKGTYVLGGNQSNKVCYEYYPSNRVLGYRWPSDF